MSIRNKSFTNIEQLSDEDIKTIFHRAEVFKKLHAEKKSFKKAFSLSADQDLNALLVFIEPSTRTRISFEMACNNLGIHPILFSDVNSSSIAKGESLDETFRTLKSLNPSVIILRYKGSHFKFDDSIPVVNGGFGSYEHPTQALIDVFTVKMAQKKLKNQNILILGDVLHSRVGNSNLKLFTKLGAKVAFCSPSSLFPKDDLWKNVHCFKDINKGLKWADVVMCLRIQQERHDMSIGLSLAEYRDQYHLGVDQLNLLKETAIILHPGPCTFGVEMSIDVFKDKRSFIIEQVTNGVFIRSAVLSLVLDFKWTFD
ncbi:MAG: aspartate carbamoyltransferase catalytic subunit [Bdellovibrionaceae bacterium]|nr:aspartate carbamoyltransferase catalytic subunit [Pseudobdellovibrionaceae bacterium]